MKCCEADLGQIRRPRLLVLGDLILDRYTWGSTERVSPEAPVLVLDADDEEVRPGGAASVAYLARCLGADVLLAGVTGDDPESSTLLRLLQETTIDSELVFLDLDRPTTTKERFVGKAAQRHPHQILRVDRELRRPIPEHLQRRLAAAIIGRLDLCEALLIADYAKGVCTPQLLEKVIAAARRRNLPVLVDPAKGVNYERYQGATLIKPNRIEAELAVGQSIRIPEDALAIGEQILHRFGISSVLVTLDSDGMALVTADGTRELYPTKSREVYDITGAGDTVLAALGLAVASDTPLSGAAELANVAAGLQVERMGVAPIARRELQLALRQERDGSPSFTAINETHRTSSIATADHPIHDPAVKQLSVEQAAKLAAAYRLQGQTVVLTNGCFDLLHAGHITCLQEAKSLGDVLIVAINSDESVRRLKGPDRPVLPEAERVALLSALTCVDHIVVYDETTPHQLLEHIRPGLLVKGGQYPLHGITGHEVVEAYGGEVRVTRHVPGISTTQLLAMARGSPPKPDLVAP